MPDKPAAEAFLKLWCADHIEPYLPVAAGVTLIHR